jgi:hypothetical protein
MWSGLAAMTLGGQQWALKIHTDADAGNDLETHDFAPVGGNLEVDQVLALTVSAALTGFFIQKTGVYVPAMWSGLAAMT